MPNKTFTDGHNVIEMTDKGFYFGLKDSKDAWFVPGACFSQMIRAFGISMPELHKCKNGDFIANSSATCDVCSPKKTPDEIIALTKSLLFRIENADTRMDAKVLLAEALVDISGANNEGR